MAFTGTAKVEVGPRDMLINSKLEQCRVPHFKVKSRPSAVLMDHEYSIAHHYLLGKKVKSYGVQSDLLKMASTEGRGLSYWFILEQVLESITPDLKDRDGLRGP